MSAQSNVLITATLDGVDLGTWLGRGDHEVTGEVLKVRQPGGGYKTYGGMATYGDLEINRTREVPRDTDTAAWIKSRVNRGILTVVESTLDGDARPDARSTPSRWVGQLSGYNDSETSTREDGERMVTLTMSVAQIG